MHTLGCVFIRCLQDCFFSTINKTMQELPDGLIDSHFHLLSMQKKGIESITLLEKMKTYAMTGIDVGVDCNDLEERALLTQPYPLIHVSAGIGPWGVGDEKPPIQEQLDTLTSLLACHTVCAIGEIGLDNYWKYGTKELQEELFTHQMDIAQERKLPIIIHNREADEQTFRIIASHSFPRRGILHCFQGSQELADLAVEKDFFISFAGNLTYKNNQRIRDILTSIPLDHLLLETDSPYLSPVPLRGKPNTPLHMIHIYELAASLKAISLETLVSQMQTNLQTFLT